MLTLVTVNMKVSKVNGVPWKNGKVKFLTVNESFTSTDQIPSETEIIVKLNDLGIGQTQLWAEDEGELETYYKCILPNNKEFTFSIPIPGLTVYELSQLRLGGIQVSDPEYQSVIDYINAYLGGITDYLPIGGNNGDILRITQVNPRIVGWGSENIPKLSQLPDVNIFPINNGILSYDLATDEFNLRSEINNQLIDGGNF
jgi:hypothetical protein